MLQETDYIKLMYTKPLWIKVLQHIYLLRVIKKQDLVYYSKLAKELAKDDVTMWKIVILLEKLELISRKKSGRKSYIYLTKRGMQLCQILNQLDQKELMKKRHI